MEVMIERQPIIRAKVAAAQPSFSPSAPSQERDSAFPHGKLNTSQSHVIYHYTLYGRRRRCVIALQLGTAGSAFSFHLFRSDYSGVGIAI